MRNGAIDIYKFIFSYLIAFYHFYAGKPREHFPLGFLGVEFFVLVSGVFFFNKWDKYKTTNVALDGGGYLKTYMFRRFKRFFSYAFVAYIVMYIIRRIFIYALDGGVFNLAYFINTFSMDIWEILLIGMNGLNNGRSFLNVPVWSLSAMLIAEFLVLLLLTYNEKSFFNLFCPLTVLFGLGILQRISSIDYVFWLDFINFGVLRVFFIMCLSRYCYFLIDYFNKLNLTSIGKLVFSISEILCYALAIIIIMNCTSRSWMIIAILLLCLACALTMSSKTYSTSLFKDSYITRILGELSFTVFLVHYSVLVIFRHMYINPYDMYGQKLFFALSVLLSAAVLLVVVKYVIKLCFSVSLGLKKILFKRIEE